MNILRTWAKRERQKDLSNQIFNKDYGDLNDSQKQNIKDKMKSKASENVIIKIIDTGCGIPEEELPRVKEKFFKGVNANSKNGIGLSICDEIIKLHGGKLDINSIGSKGTEVCIIIPI